MRYRFKKLFVTLKNSDIKKGQGFFLILFLPCFAAISFSPSLIAAFFLAIVMSRQAK